MKRVKLRQGLTESLGSYLDGLAYNDITITHVPLSSNTVSGSLQSLLNARFAGETVMLIDIRPPSSADLSSGAQSLADTMSGWIHSRAGDRVLQNGFQAQGLQRDTVYTFSEVFVRSPDELSSPSLRQEVLSSLLKRHEDLENNLDSSSSDSRAQQVARSVIISVLAVLCSLIFLLVFIFVVMVVRWRRRQHQRRAAAKDNPCKDGDDDFSSESFKKDGPNDLYPPYSVPSFLPTLPGAVRSLAKTITMDHANPAENKVEKNKQHHRAVTLSPVGSDSLSLRHVEVTVSDDDGAAVPRSRLGQVKATFFRVVGKGGLLRLGRKGQGAQGSKTEKKKNKPGTSSSGGGGSNTPGVAKRPTIRRSGCSNSKNSKTRVSGDASLEKRRNWRAWFDPEMTMSSPGNVTAEEVGDEDDGDRDIVVARTQASCYDVGYPGWRRDGQNDLSWMLPPISIGSDRENPTTAVIPPQPRGSDDGSRRLIGSRRGSSNSPLISLLPPDEPESTQWPPPKTGQDHHDDDDDDWLVTSLTVVPDRSSLRVIDPYPPNHTNSAATLGPVSSTHDLPTPTLTVARSVRNEIQTQSSQPTTTRVATLKPKMMETKHSFSRVYH